MAAHPVEESSALPALTVRIGDSDETLRPEDGPVFIGRELPAQLRVDDVRISRKHARLEAVDQRWLVVDENSRNGLYLNGERVTSAVITDGMTIHLGHVEGIAVTFTLADTDTTIDAPTQGDTAGNNLPEEEETTVGYTGEQGAPDMVRAGAAVAARREELGISQRKLMEDRIISQSVLVSIERGRSWPRERTRAKIEQYLQWPRGTIARIAYGGEAPEDDSTEVLSDSVQVAVMLDYAKIALDGFKARIDALPDNTAPGFSEQAAALLKQLRKLQTTTANATRSAPAPDIVLVLSDVRRIYNDLMLRAAGAPDATLGQRLYAARHRAELSAEEAAAAAGITVDAVAAVEDERPVPADVSAAVQALISRLTHR